MRGRASLLQCMARERRTVVCEAHENDGDRSRTFEPSSIRPEVAGDRRRCQYQSQTLGASAIILIADARDSRRGSLRPRGRLRASEPDRKALQSNCCGRLASRANDEVARGRSGNDCGDQSSEGPDLDPLARCSCAFGDGWRSRAQLRWDCPRRDFCLSHTGSSEWDLLVPQS